LQCKYVFNKWLNISGNLAVSENKIKNFTEYVDNYDTTIQSVYQYSKTNISFSPGIVGGGTITVLPIKNVELGFLSKYVGRQYLDNTSKTSRSLKPFYIQDARFSFTLPKKIFRETIFVFQLNNIFNRKYEPNGYTYSYIYGGQLSTQNNYFPMAGRNFMTAISVKL
jgi:iron complex outermembrane receptor protein